MGKRSKRAWRQVDVEDVDNFLEDQRLQERLGVDFTNKPDHELFVIDTQPAIKNEPKNNNRLSRNLSRIQRRKVVLTNEPKCFEVLKNDSKVLDPITKRNKVRVVTLSQKTLKKKIQKGVLKRKEEMARKNRAKTEALKIEQKKYRSEFKEDLWSDKGEVDKSSIPNEWFSKDTVNCNKLNSKVKKPPITVNKISAVNVPHPGVSYNPSFTAHQELMKNVIETEEKIIKEEKHLDRVTSKMFRKITPEQLSIEQNKAFKQGLDNNDDETGEDASKSPNNPPVINRKKDLKTRRHIREEKAKKAKIKQEAMEKKKLADIYKLRFFQKSITKGENSQNERIKKRVIKKKTMIKTPRVSAHVFEEPAPVFTKLEDLSGNLRNLKPQGGGLMECFTSLQRRGMTAVSTPKIIKKKSMKQYKLSSHRMPWEQIERPVKSKKKIKK